MIISCAIIDDEPLAAGLLESYTEKTPYLELQGTYNSAIVRTQYNCCSSTFRCPNSAASSSPRSYLRIRA